MTCDHASNVNCGGRPSSAPSVQMSANSRPLSNSMTITDLTNDFKTNADKAQFVQSFEDPSELRELLEKTGLEAEEINNFVGQFEGENSSGGRASLAVGLIAASFVIFQM